MKKSLLLRLSSTFALVLLLGNLAPGNPHVASVISAPFSTGDVGTVLVNTSARMLFIENVGQFTPSADFPLPAVEDFAGQVGAHFQVWGGGPGTAWLAEDAIWFTAWERPRLSPRPLHSGHPFALSQDEERGERSEAWGEGRGVHLKLTFPGANPHPTLEPFGRLSISVNYFLGNDPAQWRTDVPAYSGVRYVDLYPGLDLEVSGEGGRWSWRLVERIPSLSEGEGGNVRLRVEGASDAALAPSALAEEGRHGGLRVTTAVGEFTLPLLTVEGLNVERANVQRVNDRTFEVSSPFSSASLHPNSPAQQPAFVPQDNPNDLLYATFVGGSSDDEGCGIAVDGSGAAYVTGNTYSSGFPITPGAFDTTYNGYEDAFVVKLNAAGSAPAYITFLGGSGRDRGFYIVVDGSGAPYVTGWTESPDFPTAPGAFDTTYNGSGDVFVVKLNPSGSSLLYATFLGGSSYEWGSDVAVDGSGAAYITGWTGSSDFPATPGAFDTTHNGGDDVFVAKLNPSASSLVYATFVGGSYADYGRDIAVDGSGAAHVTGGTGSSDFPITPGAFDTTYNGGTDVFVAKLNAAGSALAYVTFLGGSGQDVGEGITVDGSGAAYVTGTAGAPDFPTTPGAFDTTYNGGHGGDAFAVKLNSSGSSLLYATFLGGSSYEYGSDIVVDGSGAAYVAGYTDSHDFPTTPGAFDTTHNGGDDAFALKLNPSASSLVYATFVGGSSTDEGYGIAVDGRGAAYVTGYTYSSDFPITPGAFDTIHNGGQDVFVAKLAMGIGQIIGWVFLDTNGDGWRQATETAGLPDVRVYAFQGDATYSARSGGTDGWDQIMNLPLGNYTVVEDQPIGYTSTSPDTVVINVQVDRAAVVNFGEQAWTATPSPTPTATSSPTFTPGPTATSSPTPTTTPSPTPTAMPSPTPTATSCPTPTATSSPTPTTTPSPTPTATPSPTTTSSPTPTATSSPTPTATSSPTPVPASYAIFLPVILAEGRW